MTENNSLLKKTSIKRRSQFYAQLELADSTKRRYKNALECSFLNNLVQQEFQKDSIFEITDLEKLWKFYSMINLNPVNIRMHRYYSAPLRKYLSFLNGGKKYGKRIDFMTNKRHRRIDITGSPVTLIHKGKNAR